MCSHKLMIGPVNCGRHILMKSLYGQFLRYMEKGSPNRDMFEDNMAFILGERSPIIQRKKQARRPLGREGAA